MHEVAKPQKRATKALLLVLFGGFVAPSFAQTKLSRVVFPVLLVTKIVFDSCDGRF